MTTVTNKWFALGVRPRVTWFVMEVVSSCPMQAMGFVWQSSAGTFAQTIVVKATYVLEPGHAKLAAEQETIHEQDQFVKGEPGSGSVPNPHGVLFAPTDRVPFKRCVDVMLVGHAYAPEKQPVRSLVTRLNVGDFSKSIEVFCDRGFRPPDERLLEGPRFTKMPLDWTRAAGGPGTTNPVGMRSDAPPDAFGLVSLPNLQPPKTLIAKGSDAIAPVGYGPIAPTWPGRTQRLERFSETFSPSGWEEDPLPEDFDFGYFQAAPPDQQLSRLRPDERLVLENLHPVHAQLVTRLPGVCPRAVVHRALGEREDVALVADTLWIDTDRGICCVVWRGSIGLRHPTEAGLIRVALVEPVAESIDENLVITIPPGVVDEDELASMTMVAPFGARPKSPIMPFVATNSPERPASLVRSQDDGALPFGPSGLSGLPPAPIARGQITLPAQSPTSSPTVPEIKVPRPAPVPPRACVPQPPPVSMVAASTTAPRVWAKSAPSRPPAARPTLDSTAGEMVQVLWYDTSSLARMRQTATWRTLLEDKRGSPHVEGEQEIFEVATQAPVADAEGVDDALGAAIGIASKFVPPLVLVAGELELPFDELEALKAAMSAALPAVSAADKQLEEAVAIAKDFVRTPGLSPAPAVSEGLTARIREAFVKEKKAFPSGYVDTQMERVLLSGRHYQKREVFGGMFVRCLTWLPGEKSALVGYLPADVSNKLPMWRRFRVRVIAEVHPAQDQYEARPFALKILGIVREGCMNA